MSPLPQHPACPAVQPPTHAIMDTEDTILGHCHLTIIPKAGTQIDAHVLMVTGALVTVDKRMEAISPSAADSRLSVRDVNADRLGCSQGLL